jgi:N-acetylmuramoyl-L-alanine amidase
MRVQYGVLGVLVIALVVLSVRAWQLFGASPTVSVAATPADSGSPSTEPSLSSPEPPVTESATPSAARVAPRTRRPTPPPPTPTSPAPTSASAPVGTAPGLHGVVIALDPGHNGANGAHLAEISRLVDAGGFRKECNTTGTATNDGYSEATFTWQLSERLTALLRQRGAQVRTTRTGNSGWGPCVDARGRFGAAVGARLELSLHADGAAAGGHGFHVIAPALLPHYTDDILPASLRLATTVRNTMRAAGFTPSSYLGSAGLDVRSDLGTLNRADVPTAMIECGNMRNAGDAALLRSAAGQARIASALADALARYLGRVR